MIALPHCDPMHDYIPENLISYVEVPQARILQKGTIVPERTSDILVYLHIIGFSKNISLSCISVQKGGE